MATLVIRGLDEEIKMRLRRLAAEHNRSMEAEARAILAAATGTDRPAYGLGSYIRARMVAGGEIEVPPRTNPARAADLS